MGIDTVYEQDMQTAHIIQPAEEMAARSVEILLNAIENGTTSHHERVPFRVSCRESLRER